MEKPAAADTRAARSANLIMVRYSNVQDVFLVGHQALREKRWRVIASDVRQ